MTRAELDQHGRAQLRAELNAQNAELLVQLARETPDHIPIGRPRSAMEQRSDATLRGIPVVGTKGDRARALAGVGPTDPWKRQQERDYATRSGQPGSCTLSHTQILALSDGRCYLCRIPLTMLTMYVDHIIPLSIDGTHTDHNVGAACLTCNSRKGAKIVSFTIRTRKPIYQRVDP